MATRSWQVHVDGKMHGIVLKHGLIPTGRIWLHGPLAVESKRNLFDHGAQHHFKIDAGPVEEVQIIQHYGRQGIT